MIIWGEFTDYDPADRTKKIEGIILLDRWAGRVNFPELKQKAKSSTNSGSPTR